MNSEISVEAIIYACIKKIADEEIEKNTASQIGELTRRIERLEQILNPLVTPQRTELRSQPSEPVQKPSGNIVNPWERIETMVKAYNDISRIENSKEQVEKRKDFFYKYKGIAICCANADERRQDGTIPMKLEANRTTYGAADYWAFPYYVGEYMVFPRSGKEYEEAVHNTAGYKEVFDSDFEEGKYYRKIEVEAPAIFTNVAGWRLKQKGKLKLG